MDKYDPALCEKLDRLREAATPGPYVYEHRDGTHKHNPYNGWGILGLWVKDQPIRIFGSDTGWEGGFSEPNEADAAYIAAIHDIHAQLDCAREIMRMQQAALENCLPYLPAKSGVERDAKAILSLTPLEHDDE